MATPDKIGQLFRQLEPSQQREFEDYYASLQEPLFHASARILYANGIADYSGAAYDCVHETFCALLHARCYGQRPFSAESGGPRHIRHWLFRVNANISFEHVREARRGCVVSYDAQYSLPLLAEAAPRPFEEVIADQLLMKNLLESLSPRLRTFLWLKYGEGWSPRQIAAMFGLSSNTVSQSLSRALKKLCKAYGTLVTEMER
jgi:RNA polymerase sigma factor (sigma-70 family)